MIDFSQCQQFFSRVCSCHWFCYWVQLTLTFKNEQSHSIQFVYILWYDIATILFHVMKSFLQFASEETIRSKFNIKLVDKVIEGMRFHVWCTEWVFPPHKYANLAFRLYRNFVEKKIAQQMANVENEEKIYCFTYVTQIDIDVAMTCVYIWRCCKW